MRWLIFSEMKKIGDLGKVKAFELSFLVSGSGAWRLVSNKLSLAALRIFVSGFFRTGFRMVVHSQGIIHFVF